MRSIQYQVGHTRRIKNLTLDQFLWKYYRWSGYWNPLRLKVLMSHLPVPEFLTIPLARRKEILNLAGM